MIEEVLLEADDDMDKAVEFAKGEFAAIRTGRASSHMFESILVEYYGSPTPLMQLASIKIPEARQVLIKPYDRNATDHIIAAIRESDLGVNPTDDGQQIRVSLPVLTEERRRDYVRQASTKAEEARIAVRNVRRKAKDALEKLKKDGEAGEDEVERAEKELENITKSHVSTVDKLLADKEKDLMEI